MNKLKTGFLVSLLVGACAAPLGRYEPSALAAAESVMTAERLLGHIRILSSDRFEGRAPGTRGEQLTVDYLERQFRDLGLAPGNPDGSYIQNVPLVGITATRSARLAAGGQRMRMRFPDDYVVNSRHFKRRVQVRDSELVFVGYGVVAPEYGWDDYKGVDVRGKTLVMLINDPAVPDPRDPAKLDERYFGGKAMTYYGRWTYKYEIASEKGAAAVLLIHETGPAGYPWEVVSGSWGREQFDIDNPDGNRGRVPAEGWITEERARTLFRLSGHDFDAMKQASVRKDFQPVALPARLDVTVNNRLRRIKSRNVIAKLEGSDPVLRDEHVVYTAHWDHLGRDPDRKGDQIFSGALDNASGTGAVLELARAFRALPAPPRRSILFLAVTAEEQGLLGSKWYAEYPLYPLVKTVANINIDGLNPWGRTHDVVVIGTGQSTLEDVLKPVARQQGRVLVPDPDSDKGFYYRSDHFEFAKVGVPALYAKSGLNYVGQPEDYGRRRRDEYIANDYHKPSDQIKPDWDLSGALEDMRMLFRVGLIVADADRIPQWKKGSEFKARRDAMMLGGS
jgi:Zn-dependent M28 family amino/carboxypeptidase